MGRTSIEWTDHSWPIVNGCRRISPGCENCYAERLIATRLSKTPKYKGLAVYGKNGPRWTGDSRIWAPHLDAPLRAKKPARVFVADMGDLFYERVTDDEIAAVFGVMAACQRHTFQVLTKRAGRMRDWAKRIEAMGGPNDLGTLQVALGAYDLLGDGPESEGCELTNGERALESVLDAEGWPLPNVWLGVSVEDRTRLSRVDELRETPAALRFLSIEPLLEDLGTIDLTGIGWVIIGGESGPGARPFNLAWAHSIVEQCAAAKVPCFVKQVGSKPVGTWRSDSRPFGAVGRWHLNHRKGADMAEWPEALRVRQFPTAASP